MLQQDSYRAQSGTGPYSAQRAWGLETLLPTTTLLLSLTLRAGWGFRFSQVGKWNPVKKLKLKNKNEKGKNSFY